MIQRSFTYVVIVLAWGKRLSGEVREFWAGARDVQARARDVQARACDFSNFGAISTN